MRKLLPFKFFSWLLLVVILTAMTHGACENAHASQNRLSAASEQASQSDLFASDQCPCCPLEHSDNTDGSHICTNCICHASLALQQFQLTYSPFILELETAHPFQHLPEVYLSKFIPPQNRV